MPSYLKYEGHEGGFKFVRYPSQLGTRLVVTFSAQGTSYNRLHQFWTDGFDEKTEYVFFLEQDLNWYLDYEDLVSRTIARFDPASVLFIGSSMGAFASLWYGAKFRVGTVMMSGIQAPPLTFHGSFKGHYHSTLFDATCQRLEVLPRLPNLYVESTGLWSERLLLRTLLDIYQRKGGRLISEYRPDIDTHRGLSLWDGPFTKRVIELFELWDTIVHKT